VYLDPLFEKSLIPMFDEFFWQIMVPLSANKYL